MRVRTLKIAVAAGAVATIAACMRSERMLGTRQEGGAKAARLAIGSFDAQIESNAKAMLDEGRRIFRYDTFGDEAFWGAQLRLQDAIAGEKNGGTGSGLSPKAALGLGLKVDADALDPATVAGIKSETVNLNDPATTLALLRANAVVGITGKFDGDGKLAAVGIQCALCHSTVDNSFAPGIGHRLDAWPNRDLDVGQIVSLAPNLTPLAQLIGVDEATVKKVLLSWGPGRYDAELNQDGKAFRPDGKTAATVLPAAFALAGVNLQTYTGWGSVTYWNAYVANTQMQGRGTFFDPRIAGKNKRHERQNVAGTDLAHAQFPGAVRNKSWDKRTTPDDDQITSKLAALHYYQLSIPAPKPKAGSFDVAQADRGKKIFEGSAKCASCHVPPLMSEPGWSMHEAREICIDDFQAGRSPDGEYRTTPLNGLFTRAKGGFYHDGRFADLPAVVDHYDGCLSLKLEQSAKADLVEYLKSL